MFFNDPEENTLLLVNFTMNTTTVITTGESYRISLYKNYMNNEIACHVYQHTSYCWPSQIDLSVSMATTTQTSNVLVDILPSCILRRISLSLPLTCNSHITYDIQQTYTYTYGRSIRRRYICIYIYEY